MYIALARDAAARDYARMRQFGPTPKDHPLVTANMTCAACHKPFVEGDYTALITLGPGDNPDEQSLARLGRAYNAVTAPVHWSCATGQPNEKL